MVRRAQEQFGDALIPILLRASESLQPLVSRITDVAASAGAVTTSEAVGLLSTITKGTATRRPRRSGRPRTSRWS